MSAHLILIRGVPGSGKSTLAHFMGTALAHASPASLEPRVIAADDWFDIFNGGQFTRDALHRAHRWCQAQTAEALAEGRDVIVHNTFTTEKELAPYLELGALHGARVISLVVENRHGNKSIHGVPEEKVCQMRERLRRNIKL